MSHRNGVDLLAEVERLSAALAAAHETIARMREALAECADDLAAEIEHRYDRIKDHPAMTPKYERDMVTVRRARAALADATEARKPTGTSGISGGGVKMAKAKTSPVSGELTWANINSKSDSA